MTKYEEIYFISNLISKAQNGKSVELNNQSDWNGLFLTENTTVSEDYLFELNDKKVLDYEEIGDDGFKPIIMCSINDRTVEYLKQLILDVETGNLNDVNEIHRLNNRIIEILSFDPKRLSQEIKSTEDIILKTKDQLSSNTILQSLLPQLNSIETHFKSLSKVGSKLRRGL